MIGRVYRGGKVAGLLRYLYGPGRHDESLHEDPHLVAAWDAETRDDLDQLEPEVLAGEGVDAFRNFGPLKTSLELATLLRPESINDTMVWHCALRNADSDRVLSDGEWGEVARDVMDRTGIAPRGDAGGCRWIAVRHDEESIHLVAVLARQDGRAVSVFRDFLHLREACRDAEQRYGLTATAPADKTAATHTSRPEVEKATRRSEPVAARDWLRGEVQHAAAASREPGAFLDRLRVAGVVVRERRDPDGQLTGYAVGRPGDLNADGQQVHYGGGKLAADLSLPRLAANWKAAGIPEEGGPITDAGDRRALWERATAAAAEAAEAVRTARAADPDAGGDAAAAAAEVLAAASRLVEGAEGGPLSQAAVDYDRAARETYRRTPPPSMAGSVLRAAAFAMARASRGDGQHRPRSSEAVQVALLVSQITQLSLSVTQLRQAQGRIAQAQAARRATTQLIASTDSWSDQAEAVVAGDQRAAAAAAAGRPAAGTTSAAAGQRGPAAASSVTSRPTAPPVQRRGPRGR